MTPSAAKRIFIRERARFAKFFPGVRATSFRLLDRRCPVGENCQERDFAFAEPSVPRISLVTRALDLPASNVVGLIRHELGHVADPNPYAPDAEQRADDIAEYVTGTKIRYDAWDIQTIGRGVYPRPRHLHR